MNDKVITYTNPSDGMVHIICPTDEGLKTKTVEQIAKRRVPEGLSYSVVSRDDIPDDRYFRNAWELVDKKVAIARPKAEAVHMDKLRDRRKKLFDKLDKDFMRAVEEDDSTAKSAIVERKRKLRDMPTTFDLTTAMSTDDIKLMEPDYLKDK